VQLMVADVDENGRALGTSTNFALCGPVRAMGESDDSMNRLATKAGRASLPASPRAAAYARPSWQCFATCGNPASDRARRSPLPRLLAFLHGSLYALSVYFPPANL
jgi:hypothetical protein